MEKLLNVNPATPSSHTEGRREIKYIPLKESEYAKECYKQLQETYGEEQAKEAEIAKQKQKPGEIPAKKGYRETKLYKRLERSKKIMDYKVAMYTKKLGFVYYLKYQEKIFGKQEERLFTVKAAHPIVWERHTGSKDYDVRASSLLGHTFLARGKFGNRRFGRFPDTGNYWGWIDKKDVVKHKKSDKPVAFAVKPEVPIFRDKERKEAVTIEGREGTKREGIPFGSKLELGDFAEPVSDVDNPDGNANRIREAFLAGDENTYWVAADGAEEIDGRKKPPEKVAEYARMLWEKAKNSGKKDTYGWGGSAWDHCDSSGFVQICLLVAGYETGRNVGSQWGECVNNSDFEPLNEEESINGRKAGDLVFLFRKGANGDPEPYHVAVAENKDEYYHSVLLPKELARKGILKSLLKNYEKGQNLIDSSQPPTIAEKTSDPALEDEIVAVETEPSQPYPAASAEWYAVMRLVGHKKNSSKEQEKLIDSKKEFGADETIV